MAQRNAAKVLPEPVGAWMRTFSPCEMRGHACSCGGEGSPISEEFKTADGYTVQYFEQAALRWKVDELVSLRPLGREIAKRLKLTTKAIERPDGIPEYDESLFEPPPVEPIQPGYGSDGFGPGPQQGGYKEIVVSISAQTMKA